MLWDLVELFLGSLPTEFSFLKIFGVLFFLYLFFGLLKVFFDFMKDVFRYF